MKGYLVFMTIAAVIVIITFIVFTVLYSEDKKKTAGLNQTYLQCTADLQDATMTLNVTDQTLRDCISSQDQLTATLEDNFIVDTSGMTNPMFFRQNTVDECNYPLLTPRWSHQNKSGYYQSCNFAGFKNNPSDQEYARCGGGNAGCSSAVGNNTWNDNAPFIDDPFIFGAYTANTPCLYWKIVNKLPQADYTIEFKYRTDSKVFQSVYAGNDPSIDSSVTTGGDSCIPQGIICEVDVNGTPSGSDPKNADRFTFPAPNHDFVITLWYNTQIARPTMTVSYLISD